MKNITVYLIMALFSAMIHAETTTSTETRFKEGTCYAQNEYCEFIDFRGKIHEYWFGSSAENPEDSIFKNVPFYVGSNGNGIWCSDGLCGNAEGEIIGLDPRWSSFSDVCASEQSSSQQEYDAQHVLQENEMPIDIQALATSKANIAGQKLYKVVIISLVQEIDVTHVLINRNEKCNDNDYIEKSLSGRVRIKFKMGEKKTVTTICDPVEVVVRTNQGEFTRTFR